MEGSKYTVHVVRTDANGSKVYDADLENGTWTGTDFTKNCTFADEGDYVVTVSASQMRRYQSSGSTGLHQSSR